MELPCRWFWKLLLMVIIKSNPYLYKPCPCPALLLYNLHMHLMMCLYVLSCIQSRSVTCCIHTRIYCISMRYGNMYTYIYIYIYIYTERERERERESTGRCYRNVLVSFSKKDPPEKKTGGKTSFQSTKSMDFTPNNTTGHQGDWD